MPDMKSNYKSRTVCYMYLYERWDMKLSKLSFISPELSMANCSKVDHLGFGELKKAYALCRLDLSRTRIDFLTLQLLLQHAGQLRHLSLSQYLPLRNLML